MLEKKFALVLSIIIFIIIFIVLQIKQKQKEEIINYVFIHFMITIVVAESFFPLIIQRAIVESEVYIEKIHTLEFFTELKLIFSLEATRAQLYRILKLHIVTVILPLFTIGLLAGFVIRMQFTSRIRFVFASLCFVIFVQMGKLIICLVTGANYIQVTPEETLYLFISCLLGGFLLAVTRYIIKNNKYKSGFFISLKRTLFRNT